MSELIQLTVCARSDRVMSFVKSSYGLVQYSLSRSYGLVQYSLLRSYGLVQYSLLGSYGLVHYSVVFAVGVVGGCIVTFVIIFVIALVLINKIKAR